MYLISKGFDSPLEAEDEVRSVAIYPRLEM
jgi:hypothetical protein